MTSHKSKQEELIRHEKSDEFYVDEEHRRCPQCLDIKMLFAFRPEGSSTTPRLKYDIVSLCNVCRDEIKAAHSQQRAVSKLAAATDAKAKSLETLTNELAKSTRRRALAQACPSLTDGATSLAKEFGGEDELWKEVTTALKSSMQSDKPDIKLKATNAIIGFIRDANKQQGDPIDLSSLSDEDFMAALREPARDLLLNDAEFRTELLNDPDVRAIFLGDLGYEVIDAESSSEPVEVPA